MTIWLSGVWKLVLCDIMICRDDVAGCRAEIELAVTNVTNSLSRPTFCDSQNQQAFLHSFTSLYLPYYYTDMFNRSIFIPHKKPEVKTPLEGQFRGTFSKDFKDRPNDCNRVPSVLIQLRTSFLPEPATNGAEAGGSAAATT